MSSSAKVKN